MTSACCCIAYHRRQMLLLVLAFLLWFFLAIPCTAQGVPQRRQDTPEEERPASESHSYMELFTKLEREWTQAVQKKDKTALDAILAPEFTLRTSEDPENLTSRADWIQKVLTSEDLRSSSQRAIVIRAFLGVAVVSFVRSEQVTINGKDRSGDYFIVDLWKANHDKWQVAARYMAPAGNNASEAGSTGQK